MTYCNATLLSSRTFILEEVYVPHKIYMYHELLLFESLYYLLWEKHIAKLSPRTLDMNLL